MDLLWSAIIGIIAGWLAGKIMSGGGYGLIGDLLLGAFGGLVGGWLFGMLGLTTVGLIGRLFTATVGAVILIWITRLLKKA
jgi:uncharacterized membrane protein YeaQ/YmgE (transglycosylase-associated protein family)